MCDNPAGVLRPIWVQVDIPHEHKAGNYTGSVLVMADNCPTEVCEVELEVLLEILPPPDAWKMHFDLWQQPESVARWHGVKPWSPEHLALMKPLMKRLADAGQKAITCAIIDEAWNGQTYDWFPSQVEWIMGADGEMRYDYSAFDTWVEFMMNEVGMKDADIFCYTMIPWGMNIKYRNESPDTPAFGTLHLDHKSPDFERVWGHFLKNFRQHLQEKGWLNRTSIALDERGDDLVRAAMAVIRKYAPELRIVSSVNKPSEVSQGVYVLSPALQHTGMLTPQLKKERAEQGARPFSTHAAIRRSPTPSPSPSPQRRSGCRSSPLPTTWTATPAGPTIPGTATPSSARISAPGPPATASSSTPATSPASALSACATVSRNTRRCASCANAATRTP